MMKQVDLIWFLIGFLMLIAFPLARLNISLVAYRVLFWLLVGLVLAGSMLLLNNPELVVDIVSLCQVYFGDPNVWVSRSNVYKENIVASYYILIIGSSLVFLVSCSREHKGMSRYRNAGALSMVVGLIVVFAIYYYVFYAETGYDASRIGRRWRSFFNSEFGLTFWNFVMLIAARDAGKIYRALANPRFV